MTDRDITTGTDTTSGGAARPSRAHGSVWPVA